MYTIKLERYFSDIKFSARDKEHLIEMLPLLLEQMNLESFSSVKIEKMSIPVEVQKNRKYNLKCKCCAVIVGTVANSDPEDREINLMNHHLISCRELQRQKDHTEHFELLCQGEE